MSAYLVSVQGFPYVALLVELTKMEQYGTIENMKKKISKKSKKCFCSRSKARSRFSVAAMITVQSHPFPNHLHLPDHRTPKKSFELKGLHGITL